MRSVSISNKAGIAWLCALSLLAHSNSKRHIKLSIFFLFHIEGHIKLGQYREKAHRHQTFGLSLNKTSYRKILWGKSRSCEIGSFNYHIVLEFDRLLGSTAAEEPVKFQSNRTILNTNLTASRLHVILWCHRILKWGSGCINDWTLPSALGTPILSKDHGL